jgi:NADH-quinone oxidoreductase subunit H
MMDFLQEHPWILIAFIAHGVVLGTVAYLILLERKTASWVQDRIGPNRVGPWGLLQPIADGLKFILKEDYRPGGVDKILFSLAPCIMILVVIISIAVLPWGGDHQVSRTIDVTGQSDAMAAATSHIPSVGTLTGDKQTVRLPVREQGKPTGRFEEKTVPNPYIEQVAAGSENGLDWPAQTFATITYQYPFQIAKLNIGVLFILGVLSLAVYGVVIGGWASNNKYSFLGALRATAQMVSYEIPLGISVLCIVIMFGTLDLGEIVAKQATYWGHILPAWNVFTQPLTFFLFLICIHAEANRAPFDLAEAEQELVGGYHTEYSAMRFALFFLAEYAGMITTSAVCVALFFGGWHIPWLDKLWPSLSGNIDPGNPAVTTSLLVCIIRAIAFFTKTIGIIFIFMWVRWSLPRFRFDQLMMLAWRALIPMSLAMLMATALVVYGFGTDGNRAYMRVGGKMALALLVANVAVLIATLIISRLLPPPPETNRRVKVVGSRFNRAPVAATN